MKSVLISIRPQWCEKIASGEKTIEVRKTAPKEVPFKAYIYCTKDKPYLYRIDDDNNFELTNTLRSKTYEYVKDYNEQNGKVIGEFICDKVDDFYCASVPYQKENNLGYGQFIDNGVYQVNGNHEGVVFERNDRYIDSMLKNKDLEKMCLSAQEIFDYIGLGKHLFAWHISDLKIYDNPKELREFYYCCKEMKANEPRAGKYISLSCYACRHNALKRTEDCSEYNNMLGYICKRNITRPPQSWQYVEEVEQ